MKLIFSGNGRHHSLFCFWFAEAWLGVGGLVAQEAMMKWLMPFFFALHFVGGVCCGLVDLTGHDDMALPWLLVIHAKWP